MLVCVYVYAWLSLFLLYMLSFMSLSFPSTHTRPHIKSIILHAHLPVFLKAVPFPLGRGVTVYISPPPYLAPVGLGIVIVYVLYFKKKQGTLQFKDEIDYFKFIDVTNKSTIKELLEHNMNLNFAFEILEWHSE